MRGMKQLGFAVLLALGAGCHHAPPTGVKPPADFDFKKTWTEVLQENVTEDSRIDLDNVKAHPEKIKLLTEWVATHGPSTTPAAFPTKDAKMAYWLDSYNVLAMYNAITNPARPKSLVGRIRFYVWTKFTVDGKTLSASAYETDPIRAQKEERVHFILNCMVKGCPKLPRQATEAEGLDKFLDGAATTFFNEDRNVKVDDAAKTVRFSQILDFYTGDFLRKSPSLIQYANTWRPADKQIPATYKVEFIPYDWRINQK